MGYFLLDEQVKKCFKMKLTLIFLAVVGLAYGHPYGNPTRDIHSDIQDFIDLVDVSKLLNILLDHVDNDAEVQEGLAYLQSDDFKDKLLKVENEAVTKALLDDLVSYDLDAYLFLNTINDLLGIEHIKPTKARHSRSVKSLLDEIVAALPLDEAKALYDEKMQSSAEWKALMEHLQSDEFKQLVANLRANADEQSLEAKLAEYGITVDEIINMIKDFLGWSQVRARTTRDIHSDIQDFLALVNVNKLLDILLDHVANDPEVQEGLAYLQSDDFKAKLLKVENEAVTKALLNDLGSYDLDAYGFMNTINDLLGIAHINPKKARQARSVRSLIDELVAALPLDQAKALYDEKMQSSADWKTLMEHLQSAEFKQLVDNVRANADEQSLEAKLAEYGITVDEIINLIKDFLGWPQSRAMSPRDIHSDIQDFVNLIPINDLLNILLDHVANDAEVQEGLAYLQSDDFKAKLQKVENEAVTKALLNDLASYDLDAYGFMNTINDLLGIEHINPKKARHARSVKSLLDELVAALPLDQAKALYDEKMQSSAEWKALMEHLQSAEFKQLVDNLRSNADEQSLEAKLAEYGITVDEIIQLIKDFLGWPQ